jgi:crotonobetainyl-CoA:carnitine CoA-transferase CaiB-like acyl-CoA transferase
MTNPRPEADATEPAGIPAELPLSGLVAVEMGHSVAAPFGGQILASLGAKVLKIEAPGHGDDARRWGPPFWHGAAATFQALNRDKLTATVDLKDPSERDRLKRFILGQADIVIQNLRPGLSERFGLGASLRDEKPSLIYCNLGAFGRVGPLSTSPGYDPLMQAFGGIMSVTGEEGRAPVRVGPSIVDMGTGMWSVIGILAAVRRRDHTGEGCVVDTSLLETALAWMTVPAAQYLASGNIPRRIGSEAAMLAPYKAYEAADGYLVIGAGNDNLFRRLCDALQRPELAGDPRFADNPSRVDNRVELNAIIEACVREHPRSHWVAVLEDAGVPCAPLQDTAEILSHPQTEALAMLQASPDDQFRIMGLPMSFGGRRPPFRRSPPVHGQDDEALPPRRTERP